MRVQVLRDACCAQDDQLGPLEATFEVPQCATIGDLVSIIVESRFLQYSSSHTSLVGFVGEQPFVRVFSLTTHRTAGQSSSYLLPSS